MGSSEGDIAPLRLAVRQDLGELLEENLGRIEARVRDLLQRHQVELLASVTSLVAAPSLKVAATSTKDSTDEAFSEIDLVWNERVPVNTVSVAKEKLWQEPFRSQDREEQHNRDGVEEHTRSVYCQEKTVRFSVGSVAMDMDVLQKTDQSIFVGQWRDSDNDNGFFGGATIEINEGSWFPASVTNSMQQNARYTCELIKPDELLMLEQRANGQVKRFHAILLEPPKFPKEAALERSETRRCGGVQGVRNSSPEDLSLPRNSSRKLVISLEGTSFEWVLDPASRSSTLYDGEVPSSEKFFYMGALKSEFSRGHVTKKTLKALATRALNSQQFEIFIGSIIIAHSCLIGLQANHELTRPGSAVPGWIHLLDITCLAIYTGELILRLATLGWRRAMYDKLFQFDSFLIVAGFFGVLFSYIESEVVQRFQKAMVFRVLRALRLLRLLKMVAYFKVLWRLALGLMDSFYTVVSTLVMMALIVYLFSLVAIEVISKDTDLIQQTNLEDGFSSLAANMLTLFRFVTMDGIGDIYQPLVEEDPWLLLFFIPLFMTLSITLLNLVTAITVEVAFDMTRNDYDFKAAELRERFHTVKPVIEEWFQQLDEEKTGVLTLNSFKSSRASKLPAKLEEYITVNSVDDMFEVLDKDADGDVEKSEFVNGLLNIAQCQKASTETVLLLKLLRLIRKVLEETRIRKVLSVTSGVDRAVRPSR